MSNSTLRSVVAIVHLNAPGGRGLRSLQVRSAPQRAGLLRGPERRPSPAGVSEASLRALDRVGGSRLPRLRRAGKSGSRRPPHSARGLLFEGGLGRRPGRGAFGGRDGCLPPRSSPGATFLDLRERGGWRRPGARARTADCDVYPARHVRAGAWAALAAGDVALRNQGGPGSTPEPGLQMGRLIR